MQQAKNTIQSKETWEDLLQELKIDKLGEQICDQLETQYSSLPTKIQLNTIDTFIDEHINSGEKKKQLFFTSAPGGSGKTLSFSIPAIIDVISRNNLQQQVFSLKEKQKVKGKEYQPYVYSPWVIILADTKVLINQLSEEVQKCIPEKYEEALKISCIYSGQTRPDVFGQICITTLSMLQTLVSSTLDQIILNDVTLFISDEAEHVYNYNPDIMDQLINNVSKNEKISLMFASATLTKEFENKMIKAVFGGPSSEQNNNTHKNKIKLELQGVEQYAVSQQQPYNYEEEEIQNCCQEIFNILEELYQIKEGRVERLNTQVMIFADSIKQIDQLFKFLAQDCGLNTKYNKTFVKVIHSKMATKNVNNKIVADIQKNNIMIKEIFKDFRQNKFQVLICSDIMARGIDIDQVGLVINLFPPRVNMSLPNSEIQGAQYMHRIARTGRHVKKGVVLTFYRHMQSQKFTQYKDSDLEKVLKEKVEGLEKNNITELQIAKDYIKILAQETQKAVEFNTTVKQEKVE